MNRNTWWCRQMSLFLVKPFGLLWKWESWYCWNWWNVYLPFPFTAPLRKAHPNCLSNWKNTQNWRPQVPKYHKSFIQTQRQNLDNGQWASYESPIRCPQKAMQRNDDCQFGRRSTPCIIEQKVVGCRGLHTTHRLPLHHCEQPQIIV